MCLMEMNTEITQLQNSNPTLAGTKRDIAEKFNHTCARIAWSHKSRATVDYTLIGVEPHGPTQGVWLIATVTNGSQLHLVASSI